MSVIVRIEYGPSIGQECEIYRKLAPVSEKQVKLPPFIPWLRLCLFGYWSSDLSQITVSAHYSLASGKCEQ